MSFKDRATLWWWRTISIWNYLPFNMKRWEKVRLETIRVLDYGPVINHSLMNELSGLRYCDFTLQRMKKFIGHDNQERARLNYAMISELAQDTKTETMDEGTTILADSSWMSRVMKWRYEAIRDSDIPVSEHDEMFFASLLVFPLVRDFVDLSIVDEMLSLFSVEDMSALRRAGYRGVEMLELGRNGIDVELACSLRTGKFSL
jgi:hypothetical protein